MTEQDRARLIAALTHLKVPFDRKQISKLPASAGRPALDYVNHAHVTTRLNAYAEDWTYTVDEQFQHGGQFWIRGTMTICGVSRVEYGQGKNPLEAASHFIRRAAMRFGVGTDLWAKEELEPAASAAPVLATVSGAQAGDGATHPSVPGAAERPEPVEVGEGLPGSGSSSPAPDAVALHASGPKASHHVAAGDVVEEAGSATAWVAPPPPDLQMKVAEPHEHVASPKRLASGKPLCKVCGAPFKPEPVSV